MADVIVLGAKVSAKALHDKLGESAAMMKCGVNTLEQLSALLLAISDRVESKSTDFGSLDCDHIRSLAQMGRCVAEDMANSLGCDQEKAMEVLRIPA